MKPYPKYKPSGIDWIGEIPEHWDVKKLKYYTEIINGFAFDANGYVDDGVPIIRIGDVNHIIDLSNTKRVPFSLWEKLFNFRVKRGDILLALTGATIGKSSEYDSDEPALLNQRVAIVRPSRKLNNDYLKYIINSELFIRYIDYECLGGAQENIGKPEVGNNIFAYPTLSEQLAIANYLDDKTNKIDKLIEKKQALINLLKEERIAIINQAVTKGLDPNVKMKDSGIEWLGEIPEHWEISKIKNEVLFLNHKRVPLSSEERGAMTEKIYDYYGASGVIDQVENYIFDETLILVGEDGANLYSRSTPLAFLAVGKYWVNNHAHILKPKKGNIDYLVDLLESLDYTPFISGSAQPKLTIDNLANIQIPVPTIEEQNKIAKFITDLKQNVNKTILRTEKEIELLQEYRTALISEVVTGKVDVRGVLVNSK